MKREFVQTAVQSIRLMTYTKWKVTSSARIAQIA